MKKTTKFVHFYLNFLSCFFFYNFEVLETINSPLTQKEEKNGSPEDLPSHKRMRVNLPREILRSSFQEAKVQTIFLKNSPNSYHIRLSKPLNNGLLGSLIFSEFVGFDNKKIKLSTPHPLNLPLRFNPPNPPKSFGFYLNYPYTTSFYMGS